MNVYPPKINARLQSPKHAGKIAEADAVGTSAAFSCGAVVRFYLQIEKQTKEIVDAKFQTSGCGYLIAATDILAEKIIGKTPAELHGLDHSVLRIEIESALGEFPTDRRHCLELGLDALQKAFTDFRALQVREFAGEKALICTCFGVSEEKVEFIVAEKSLATVEDVADLCNAGDGCGSCRPLIQEIIDIYWQERF